MRQGKGIGLLQLSERTPGVGMVQMDRTCTLLQAVTMVCGLRIHNRVNRHRRSVSLCTWGMGWL